MLGLIDAHFHPWARAMVSPPRVAVRVVGAAGRTFGAAAYPSLVGFEASDAPWDSGLVTNETWRLFATLPREVQLRALDPNALPFRIPDTTEPEARIATLDVIADVGMHQPEVQRLAAALVAEADRTPHPGVSRERRIAETMLSFVQNVGYVCCPVGEWLQSVLYTLGHRGNAGECKALSTLLTALLRLAGIDASTFWLFQDGAPLNHVTARAKIDGQVVWVEPSVRGAVVGENPYHAAERLGQHRNVGLRK